MEVESERVCARACVTSTQKDFMYWRELNNKVIEERRMHLEDRKD